MKVRTKFTIFISLASFISVAFFSAYAYHEVKEEFYEQIDFELTEAASLIYDQLSEKIHRDTSFANLENPRYLLKNYWLRVFTDSGRTLLTTPLGEHTAIPQPEASDKPYFTKAKIAQEFLFIPPSEKDEMTPGDVKLLVRMFKKSIGSETITVHIAKPVPLIHFELQEILLELIRGVLFTIVVIISTAYIIAGRFLQPLNTINKKIAEIREQSLSERIPIGKSRDELHTLSTSLNSMFDRLEHSFQRQRDFIGNAAHEMKSPLTILMLGHEEMLTNDPDSKVRHALEKQLSTMQRLNKLIRDLLSIARFEQRDALQRKEFVVSELIQEVMEDYAEIITHRKITVTTDLPPLMVNADYEKLQRLFVNLIDNAIKYNDPQNGMINIAVRKGEKAAIISIANSGKTIPEKDLPHIFKQFYRVEKSRSQTYGGTGLGLTIARKIVEMHAGTITTTSANNMTVVTITLYDN
ncbi:sensor histidine kinase [Desulfosediminicola flagellatus]|uniref:sensor histidine kinase n=1 Tax=Desulfosediminicola flagellatus TaxID=2569541 RepID=UPI0010AD8595|nr:ATP-binding protein [Desulfosediminicola flagellatus]